MKTKKMLQLLWISVFVVTILVILHPVGKGISRLFLVLSIPFLFLGTSIFIWEKKKLRYLPFALLPLLTALFFLPGKSIKKEQLQENYLDNLKSYTHTRYVWGGENFLGIDCSGLVRKALIQATLKQGIQELNSTLLRSSIEMWWYDCSARSLRDEYREMTKRVFAAKNINSIISFQLKPGDLAVTSSGQHVLAYLGNQEWIEADPDLDIRKVITVRAPSADNPWLKRPVYILRWRLLKE